MKHFVFTTLFLTLWMMATAQIGRVEPPFWWTEMNSPSLQLMMYGEDIGGSKVSIDYQGVGIMAVHTPENPNYLFIDLELSQDVEPGSFEISLSQGNKVVGSYSYELKSREPGSANREGFNNSDVMYLITPDRFANGDPGNDEIEGMPDGLNREDRNGRHGGDIRGLLDNLDYIAGMGFTAMWLNPLLENNQPGMSYHGYSTTDYYKIDPRFGSNEDYRELCLQAKEKGIKIVMDLIFNHCGSGHWWMDDMPSGDWINSHPEYVQTTHTHTVNQDPYVSAYDRKMMVDGWFVQTMPDLNQRNPFMANYLIQNSIWWIEYAGLAGIRQDTYPYPDKDMMAKWNKRVLDEYPGFNIVGEEWSLNPGLIAYWQKGQINKDGYQGYVPSMMDFPLQDALSRSLRERKGWNAPGWKILYDALSSDFLYPDPYNLVIFLDNHDMPRFYMQLGMDQDLYRLGITYLLTTRGIPQIYYGSEILMTHKGGGHGVIRSDFPGGWKGDKVNGFTGENLTEDEKAMQAFFRKLLQWRKESPVIHGGKLIHYVPQRGIYVYGRYNADSRVMILLNQDSKDVELKLDRYSELIGRHTSGRDVISGKVYELGEVLRIPALTPLVLELSKEATAPKNP